jgi:hypothetical protein
MRIVATELFRRSALPGPSGLIHFAKIVILVGSRIPVVFFVGPESKIAKTNRHR